MLAAHNAQCGSGQNSYIVALKNKKEVLSTADRLPTCTFMAFFSLFPSLNYNHRMRPYRDLDLGLPSWGFVSNTLWGGVADPGRPQPDKATSKKACNKCHRPVQVYCPKHHYPPHVEVEAFGFFLLPFGRPLYYYTWVGSSKCCQSFRRPS